MKFDIALNIHEPLVKVRRLAVLASKGVFNRIWVIDFPGTRLSSVVAAALAEDLSSTRFGLGLLSPFLYSPTQVSRIIETLAVRYGDRFDVLIGPGDRGMLVRAGVPFEGRGIIARLREFLQTLKSDLQQRGLTTAVLLGAQGPKMIDLSSTVDGVLLNYTDPSMLEWALSLLRDVPSHFQIGAFPPTKLTDSGCRDDLAFKYSTAIVALGLAKSVASQFGLLDDLGPAKQELRRRGGVDSDILDLLPPDMLSRFGLCGGESELKQYLHNVSHIGIDVLVFGPPVGSSQSQMKRLVEILNQV